MSDTARDYQAVEATSTDGMEELFDLAPVPADANPCQAPVPTSANGCLEPVPVEIAAHVLGISLNAIKKQLRKGNIAGFKQETKHGNKWFVEPSVVFEATQNNRQTPVNSDIWLAPVPTSANLCLVKVLNESEQVPTDANLCQSSLVNNAELVSNEESINFPTSQLLELLDKQNKELQAAYWRNGRLENQVEELQQVVQFQQEQLRDHMKLLTDSQHKPGWWAKFSSWFFKGQ